ANESHVERGKNYAEKLQKLYLTVRGMKNAHWRSQTFLAAGQKGRSALSHRRRKRFDFRECFFCNRHYSLKYFWVVCHHHMQPTRNVCSLYISKRHTSRM